jgi:hypothetical protein
MTVNLTINTIKDYMINTIVIILENEESKTKYEMIFAMSKVIGVFIT